MAPIIVLGCRPVYRRRRSNRRSGDRPGQTLAARTLARIARCSRVPGDVSVIAGHLYVTSIGQSRILYWSGCLTPAACPPIVLCSRNLRRHWPSNPALPGTERMTQPCGLMTYGERAYSGTAHTIPHLVIRVLAGGAASGCRAEFCAISPPSRDCRLPDCRRSPVLSVARSPSVAWRLFGSEFAAPQLLFVQLRPPDGPQDGPPPDTEKRREIRSRLVAPLGLPDGDEGHP